MSKPWLIRSVGDLYSYEINLEADPDAMVPMCVGQTVSGHPIPETRMYSIRELRRMAALSTIVHSGRQQN